MTDEWIDWPGLLQIAVQQMGLRPAEFWDLTPVEFLLLAGLAPGRNATMTRAEFNTLRAQFPDTSGEQE